MGSVTDADISVINESAVTTESSVTETENAATTENAVTETENAVTETENVVVETENVLTTEQIPKIDFPEVKLEREENEVEIDGESEKESALDETVVEEEFAAEQPRSFS